MQYPILVKFTVELNDNKALAFAQFLKRAGLSDFRAKATTDDEAYLMQSAGTIIQSALAGQGFSPR